MIRNLSTSDLCIPPPRLPVSGPPGYDTLDQRLSSPSAVLSYYFHQRIAQQEDNKVDIHVLIADMGQQELSYDISDIFGIPYLSDVDGF